MSSPKKRKQGKSPKTVRPGKRALLSEAQSRLEQFLQNRRRLIWSGLFVLLAPLYFSVASNEVGGHPLGGDDLNYLFLAKALAQGQGYVDLYLPDHPPHTKYPPLFPLLLVPFTMLGKYQILGSHLLISGIALTIPFLLAGWMRRQGYSETATLGVLLLAALMPRYYQFLLFILSEIPFMAFCYLALWWMAKIGPHSKSKDLGIIILATCGAFFTRTAGIALAAAIGIELWRRPDLRHFRFARIPWPVLFAGAVAFAFTIWSLRNRAVDGASLGYFRDFLLKDPYNLDAGSASGMEILDRFISQARYYFPLLALQVTLGVIHKETIAYFYFLLIIPIVTGFLARLSRPDKTAEWFFLFSSFMVIGWPFQESRLMLPILPLASFYLVRGIGKILEWMMTRIRLVQGKELAGIVSLVLVLLIMINQIRVVKGMVRFEHTDRLEPAQPLNLVGYGLWKEPVINWAKYIKVRENHLQYITRHFVINRIAGQLAPPGQVILSRKPLTTAWLADRPSISYLFTKDVQAQWRHLHQNRISYVYLYSPEPELVALQQSCPHCFKPLVRSEDGFPALYKIVVYPDGIDTPQRFP